MTQSKITLSKKAYYDWMRQAAALTGNNNGVVRQLEGKVGLSIASGILHVTLHLRYVFTTIVATAISPSPFSGPIVRSLVVVYPNGE